MLHRHPFRGSVAAKAVLSSNIGGHGSKKVAKECEISPRVAVRQGAV